MCHKQPKASAAAPKAAAKRKCSVLETTVGAATSEVSERSIEAWPALKEEAPTKLSRWEAMWTDCDPAQWEYIVV